MSELSFQRVTTGIIDVADTMKGQVVRFGSLEAAIRNGHGPALRQQLATILTMCNSLDR